MGLRCFGRLTGLVGVILLTGCSLSALDVGEADIDRSLVTGAIAPPVESMSTPLPAMNHAGSEGFPAGTAALLQAMVAQLGPNLEGELPVSWADEDSGVQGVVSYMIEDANGNCRHFTTSRESFDGIRLYRGRLCVDPEFGWQIDEFEAV
ncbi:RT0821/Lpp0805 family surface protein [Nitratireductor kimnyeongensis]|uniref:RT0821/Lpp0805 family surface protein n=1 Tax=Nitratireductor kimnyeongensis TaxID=430679 RepID=A0ABW0T6L6_9HYPH|nr:RT0821/Lpp0805 family surface protein [Nitratireductor kimnyeongensis]QZZ34901.1 hypothetical protein KW403_14055 [Nitratireductor kimnyeongensis]